jgi:hypothetical protein
MELCEEKLVPFAAVVKLEVMIGSLFFFLFGTWYLLCLWDMQIVIRIISK